MILSFLKILSVLVNLIPKAVTNFVAWILSYACYYVVPFRKKVIFDNLKLAFKTEKSNKELQQIILKNYEHYALTLFEVLRSITWTTEDYCENVLLEGMDFLTPCLEKGQGGIFLGNHLGNWEFALAIAVSKGIPIDVVVKESKSKSAQMFLDWYRKRTGLGVFLETGTTRDILRSFGQGRFVTFVLDQFMGPPIGLPVKFFGEQAGTAVALALFTEKREIPVFPAYNYRDQTGRSRTVILPKIEYKDFSTHKETRLYQRTQVYNDVLEKIVRKHPEQWLWLHRRWKDFNGEARWNPKPKPKLELALSSILVAFFLSSCVSKESTTPTGISLPADPTIAVPEFIAALPEDSRPSTPISIEEVIEKKTSKKKKASGSRPLPSPIAAPSIPAVQDSSSFHVVPSDKIPYEIGERLVIELKWLAIPAGTAVLEVKDGPIMNGRPTFHFWGNALSSRIVDAVYHVDNTAESFVDKEGLLPYKFLLHMVETQQLKETRVSFDHTKGKAYYWAKRISQRWGDQNIDRVDALVPKAQDLWSAIYFARFLNYKLNEKQVFPVYENGQNWNVELLPVANELVTSGVGAFQCWKIKVTVSLNNVFKPMGDVFLWLSDDSKKYLVKFDAKIKIGSLYGVLTSIKEH